MDISLYSVPSAIVFLAQLACAVHVFKTGRPYWWIFPILFFPLLGVLVYFIVEVLPELRGGRLGAHAEAARERMVSPGRRIRQAAERLEISPTVENRVALADAHMRAGHFAQAAEIYGDCASGIYSDDPFILFELAQAHFRNKDHEAAAEALDRIDAADTRERREQRQLLRARVLEAMGQTGDALAAYRKALPGFPGEEARFRYAQLLEREGRKEEAQREYGEIVKNARSAAAFYNKQERPWIAGAKRGLKD